MRVSVFQLYSESLLLNHWRHRPLFSVCAGDIVTNRLGGKKWRVKDWGHLPSAVKEALAAAAAFSRAIRIKPKSRGALPIRLALPPVIAAKKHDTSWHDKHDDTNHLFSILKVLVGGLLYNLRLMAQFKSTTVNRTVRKHNLAVLKRTHETLNYFFYWLLSEFQQVT